MPRGRGRGGDTTLSYLEKLWQYVCFSPILDKSFDLGLTEKSLDLGRTMISRTLGGLLDLQLAKWTPTRQAVPHETRHLSKLNHSNTEILLYGPPPLWILPCMVRILVATSYTNKFSSLKRGGPSRRPGVRAKFPAPDVRPIDTTKINHFTLTQRSKCLPSPLWTSSSSS